MCERSLELCTGCQPPIHDSFYEDHLHAITCTVVFFLLDYPAPRSNFGTGWLDAIIMSATLNTPIKDVVILVALTNEEITEEFAQVGIVRLIIEAKSTSVIQEDAKLGGESTTQEIRGSGHFLLHDTIVLLLLRCSLEALPGKGASKEVHQDVSKRFEIIATSLLDTQVSVDGGVAGSSSEILVLSVRDMKMGLGVTELLGETEIDDIDLIASLSDAHEEVVGFDIAMNEISRVDIFDTRNLWQNGVRKENKKEEATKDYQLISKEENGLETKFAVTEVEKILQRGPEEIKDHGIVVAFCAKPSDKGNTDTTSKGFVDLGFIL